MLSETYADISSRNGGASVLVYEPAVVQLKMHPSDNTVPPLTRHASATLSLLNEAMSGPATIATISALGAVTASAAGTLVVRGQFATHTT